VSLAVTALLLLIAQIEERAHDPTVVAEAANELRQALLVAEQDPVGRLNLSTAIELERIVPLSVAALLRGVSVDTIARHFSEYIILTGTKTRGIRIKHVLQLGEDSPQLPRPRCKKIPLAPPRKRRFGQGSQKGRIVSPELAPTPPPDELKHKPKLGE
jgi:hypothetical protein